ncbi:hypothetical protein D3C83_216180 [compost metagenome]
MTISHRPSLLGSVDRLLVLRDGMVDAYGPRAEVMARLTARGGAPAKTETPQIVAGGRPA